MRQEERLKIINAIKETPLSMRQAAISIEMAYTTFIRKAKELEIYNPNQGGKGMPKPSSRNQGILLDEILEGKHPQYKSTKLKERLLREGFKRNVCDICDIEEWQGKKIVIELDHIDGDSSNHKEVNLRMLCPNCHSQTSNSRGRNKKAKKAKFVGDIELLDALKENNNISQALMAVGLVPRGANYKKAQRLLTLINHI